MSSSASNVGQGNWTDLPRHCGGNVEVWDQTVGCPECGMNLWFLPDRDCWPAWDADNEPPWDWWEICKQHKSLNPYEPYFTLFDRIHPHQFGDCHDPGDEDAEAR
jgi:hypothetical protein